MAPVRSTGDLDGFAMMAHEWVGDYLVVGSSFLTFQRARVIELALKHRLPGMFETKMNLEKSGLRSYSADFNDMVRRVAIYIDKILKVAKPADLPSFQIRANYQCQNGEGALDNHSSPGLMRSL